MFTKQYCHILNENADRDNIMRWQLATAGHIGGRMEQQDRTALFNATDRDDHLLIVADGMGGHQGGALAAQTVVDTAQMLWAQYKEGREITRPANFLYRLLTQSHQAINQVGAANDLTPHSTCVALFLRENKAWWTHLGDSRLYHFRKDEMLQRTRDHSLVQILVDMGRIDEDEMGTHPDQGCLLKGLGGDETLDLECTQEDLQDDDAFLLCSDGLWERIKPDEMYAHFSTMPPTQAATTMVDIAVERGGAKGDNVSIALAVNA